MLRPLLSLRYLIFEFSGNGFELGENKFKKEREKNYLLTMTRIIKQPRNTSESFIFVQENILKSDLIYLLRRDQRCYVHVFMFYVFFNWPGDSKHLGSAGRQANKYIAPGGMFFMFFYVSYVAYEPGKAFPMQLLASQDT
jgi:hypothetical protein